MMQTTTRRFDFGIAGAVTSRPCLSGCFRVFGDIETYNGARDTSCGRLAEGNQCYKSWDCSSYHRDPPWQQRSNFERLCFGSVRRRSWDEGARIPPARKKWHPSSSAVQSLVGSAATNSVRTFTSYL